MPPSPAQPQLEFPRKFEWLALVALVALGAALRIWQYAANSSLWLDEVALAMGIVRTDLMGLLTAPLPYDQVAPKGFLLLQKLAVLAFGPSDYALRLVPFSCSLVALVVFARLATKMLDGVAPVAAVLLFATAAPLIAFSALVKQYTADVCVAVLLLGLAWELTSQPLTTPRAVRATLAGAALVWLSQPGVLIVGALGALFVAWPLVLSSRLGPPRSLIALLAGWGLSALAVTLAGFASMTAPTREYMLRFWAAGFPPSPLSQVLHTFWPWDRLMALFGGGPAAQAGLGYPLPAQYAVLAAGGLGLLWRRNRRASLLLAAPLVVTLGAAVAKQYPFSDRLILFLVPALMLAIAAAIEGLRRLVQQYSPVLAWAITIGLLGPAVWPVAATPPVYLFEHVKPALAVVQAERRSGDGIYVYYGAAPVVAFYAPQYGLERTDYSVGGCHRGTSRRYLEELDTFRGRPRVWVLLTHSLPRYREREDILAYLDTIGTRRYSLTVPSRAVGRTPLPAEAFLFDLSDPAKAATVSAVAFSLSGSTSVDPRLGCGEGPQALFRTDFR